MIAWCAAGVVYALTVTVRYSLGLSFWLQNKYPEVGAFVDGWGPGAARKHGRVLEDFAPEGGDPELDRRRGDAKRAAILLSVTGFLAVAWFLVYTGFFG